MERLTNGSSHEGGPAPARFLLTIAWDGPGSPVTVTGPVADKMICYAMLEAAKDAVRGQGEPASAPLIARVGLRSL